MLVCGEASGDLYGGALAASIRSFLPDAYLQGIGGDSMKKAGVDILYPVSGLSVMGFGEVLSHLPKFFALRNRLVDRIFDSKTSAVILIDFPDFNLRLAEKIFKLKKRYGLTYPKIFYFVPPQVWIWRKYRINQIRRFCDAVFPLFSFEHELYTERGIKSFYFGHPLLDIQNQYYEKAIENQVSNTVIGLFPGSRKQEITKILPVMLASITEFMKQPSQIGQQVTLLISRCPWIQDSLYSKLIRKSGLPATQSVKWVENSGEIISRADLILSKSGTVNLEIALHNKPYAVVYKTSILTWLIAKVMVRIRYISLVNLLSKREIVREFVQFRAEPEAIADEMMRMRTDRNYVQRMQQGLAEFTDRHLKQNAGKVTDRIAEQILNEIKKSDDP